MTAIPFHPFLKIRFFCLIISFLVTFSVVGMVKTSFAEYPGECTYTASASSPDVVGFGYGSPSVSINDQGIVKFAPWETSNRELVYVSVVHWYYENDKWHTQSGSANRLHASVELPGVIVSTTDYTANFTHFPPNGCSDLPCYQEKETKKQECAAQGLVLDETTWNDETCTGDCIPCKGCNDGPPPQCPVK